MEAPKVRIRGRIAPRGLDLYRHDGAPESCPYWDNSQAFTRLSVRASNPKRAESALARWKRGFRPGC